MSTGLRLPLSEAIRSAEFITRRLAPSCDRIDVAGSIRRGKADVGDIEIVAVPLMATVPDGLFGEQEISRLSEAIDRAIADRVLLPHPTDPKRGERYSKLLDPETGLGVDIFAARAQTFGLIYLIRTGPAAFSQKVMVRARSRGYHVAGGELHKGSMGCAITPCEFIPTPHERSVFEALGAPWVSPEDRA